MEERASPRGTASLLVLQDNHMPMTTDAVRWAVDALSDGYDTPSLRILAGLDLGGLPNSFEAGTLVEAALRELAVPKTDRDTRARLYVREVCAAMIAGELQPLFGVDLIHRRVITPLQHPLDLMAWCHLWEGNSADCTRELLDSEREKAILDYATQFLGADAQQGVGPDGRPLAASARSSTPYR